MKTILFDAFGNIQLSCFFSVSGKVEANPSFRMRCFLVFFVYIYTKSNDINKNMHDLPFFCIKTHLSGNSCISLLDAFFFQQSIKLLLMEKTMHHLGCTKGLLYLS